MRETLHYRWLRVSIVATAVVIGVGIYALGRQVWLFLGSAIWPSHYTCGCATLLVHPSWWAITMATILLGMITVTVGRGGWRLWKAAQASRKRTHELMALGITHMTDVRFGHAYAQVGTDEPFALTLGLLRPRIFVSRGLVDRLETKELQAVLRHERAHQQARDPLMTVFIDAIVAALFWLPTLRSWRLAACSLRELAADAFATDNYHSTGALSSAFLKLADATSSTTGTPFSPNSDRLEKLIDHRWRWPHRPWGWTMVSSIGLAVTALILMTTFAQAERSTVKPSAVIACRQTETMCRSVGPMAAARLACPHGNCASLNRGMSPLYALTPIQR